MKIFDILFRENFWISYYRAESESIFSIKDNKAPWHKVTVRSNRYWVADPFIVNENDKFYIFGELMDRKTSRGLHGYAELNPNDDTEITYLHDLGCHTSYPDIFKYDGTWYMIPETCARNTLELYKAVEFPNHWEKVGNIINNRKVVDTTLYFRNNIPYIFLYHPNGFKNMLSIAELDVHNCSIKNEQNVKVYSEKIGRPGGNIIKEGNQQYRVTQYGNNYYGEKLVFKKFVFDNGYQEEDVLTLMAEDFHVHSSVRFTGTHTYNKCNGVEIVDFRYYRYVWTKPLETFCKLFRIFGFKFDK